jgi:4-hydroxybenzoate polyprenyltransferase
MKELLSLIRIRQWYKNLVVFLAIFFSGNLLNGNDIYLTIIAFFSLSFVSSSYYIINDLVDLKKDKFNPEKKNRPLVKGSIKRPTALILMAILFILGLLFAVSINEIFLYFVILLFVVGLVYTFLLKNIVFADILAIATLFVIRAISGAFAIEVKVSPWLILCPFFLSLFLSVGKRQAEIILMSEHAHKARKVLKQYSNGMTNSLMIIATTLLVISYALYSFLSEHPNLLYTLPFALYVIFRFYYLINSGSIIARHPEKVVRDKAMIIGILLWLVVTVGVVYL